MNRKYYLMRYQIFLRSSRLSDAWVLEALMVSQKQCFYIWSFLRWSFLSGLGGCRQESYFFDECYFISIKCNNQNIWMHTTNNCELILQGFQLQSFNILQIYLLLLFDKFISLFYSRYLRGRSMKLLLKIGEQVKTVEYDHQTNLKVLCKQIGLLNSDVIKLTYKDDQGDMILVTCDEDLKVVIEMAKPKQMMVLFVDLDDYEAKKGGKASQEANEEIRKQMKSESENVKEKKQKKKKKKEEKRKQKEIKRNRQREQLSEIIGAVLEEKLQYFVPCIAKQVYSKLKDEKQQKKKNKKNTLVVHDHIKCNGCAVQPIQGVRYQCLNCLNFNLCENCEKDIDHPHNLLKMKKVQDIQKIVQSYQSSDDNEFTFLSKKEQQQKMESKKQKKPKDIKNVKKYNKFTRILMEKFGHEESQCSQFAKRNLHLDKDMLISRYRKQYNIPLTNEELLNRVIKLQFYFSAMKVPEDIDLEKLVFQNQDKKVANLLLDIKQRHPDFNFDPQNQEALFRMNRKFKRQKKEVESWVNQSKLVGSPILPSDRSKQQQKIENIQSELPEQNLSLTKKQSRAEEISKIQIDLSQKEIREKGRILLEMKQIFGENRTSDLYKFIEKNFELGMQAIIQKWLAEEYDQKIN